MPRRARLIIPGVAVHIVQRGNNRQQCFYSKIDYHIFLSWLHQYAQLSSCAVHAYVMMTNHFHLLVTPGHHHSAGELMKRLGQRYAQYINRSYQRSGTLWENRYRSCLALDDNYVLTCQRYIELNPVRAGIVDHPRDYYWSSYSVNAEGYESDLISEHQALTDLGRTKAQRRTAYKELFRERLKDSVIDEIRKITNGNFALGGEDLQNQVAKALGRRVTPKKSGRPRRK